jgi:hypothetical protein
MSVKHSMNNILAILNSTVVQICNESAQNVHVHISDYVGLDSDLHIYHLLVEKFNMLSDGNISHGLCLWPSELKINWDD